MDQLAERILVQRLFLLRDDLVVAGLGRADGDAAIARESPVSRLERRDAAELPFARRRPFPGHRQDSVAKGRSNRECALDPLVHAIVLAGIGERPPDQRPARHAFDPGNLPGRPAFPAEQRRRACRADRRVAGRESLSAAAAAARPDAPAAGVSMRASTSLIEGIGAAGPAGAAGAGAGAGSGSAAPARAQAQAACLARAQARAQVRGSGIGLRLPVDDRLQPPDLALGATGSGGSGWAAPQAGRSGIERADEPRGCPGWRSRGRPSTGMAAAKPQRGQAPQTATVSTAKRITKGTGSCGRATARAAAARSC